MPLLNLFWTMLMVFLWVMWIVVFFRLIGDVFRSDDLGNWAKAGWCTVLILLPFVGAIVYIIARGRGMAAREMAASQQREQQLRDYVREIASPANGSTADLEKLADLRDRGVLTEDEFRQQKTKLLTSA